MRTPRFHILGDAEKPSNDPLFTPIPPVVIEDGALDKIKGALSNNTLNVDRSFSMMTAGSPQICSVLRICSEGSGTICVGRSEKLNPMAERMSRTEKRVKPA
jgi:hypothetical protein